FELLRGLEEADDLAVLGIRGHPVPCFRREGWRTRLDDRMEPFGHRAIRFLHLRDLREQSAFPIRLLRARAALCGRLHLLDVLLHRGSFLVRESLELLVRRGGALGGLLRVLLWAHRNPRWMAIDCRRSKVSPGIKGTHHRSRELPSAPPRPGTDGGAGCL